MQANYAILLVKSSWTRGKVFLRFDKLWISSYVKIFIQSVCIAGLQQNDSLETNVHTFPRYSNSFHLYLRGAQTWYLKYCSTKMQWGRTVDSQVISIVFAYNFLRAWNPVLLKSSREGHLKCCECSRNDFLFLSSVLVAAILKTSIDSDFKTFKCHFIFPDFIF